MHNYKLYKVTIEKQFVIAAPADLSITQVENSVPNIMCIHSSTLENEGPTQILAEEIVTLGDLPDDWELNCLPYTNYRPSQVPEELVNKSIKELL